MTPLVLVTGFLGSGKTTLLRGLLPLLGARNLRPHVIPNDYANAALDSATLRGLGADIIPLTGSCVCCDAMDDLFAELEEMPAADRDLALIECNGTTDPLPLLERLLVLPAMNRRFPAIVQANLVDCRRWGQVERRGLERLQGRSASHLLFTWSDQVSEERRMDVRRDVFRLNPRVRETTPEALAEHLGILVEARAQDMPRRFVSVLDRVGALTPTQSSKSGISGVTLSPKSEVLTLRKANEVPGRLGESHALSHGFSALQFEIARRIHPLTLINWLDRLPRQVMRAKGLVEFSSQPGWYSYFQRVEESVSFHEFSLHPPDDRTLALLIGIGLDEEKLRRSFERSYCLGPGPTRSASND